MTQSDKFVASNGRKVEFEGYTLKVSPISFYGFEPEVVEALREFFLAERDKELGRWRSEEQPSIVAYQRDREPYRFMDENNGESEFYSRRQAGMFGSNRFSMAAEEYFDAHPEPKPWHDAQPGEVWILTVDGRECAQTVNGYSKFSPWGISCTADGNVCGTITAGRRIWPEVADSSESD